MVRPTRLQTMRHQRGAVTLIITLLVVLAIALLTFTMTTTTTLENRITATDLRSKQALHAAQAGLDFALQSLISDEIADLNNHCDRYDVDGTHAVAGSDQPTFELFFGEVTPSCPYPPLGLQTQAIVRSVGRSADGSAVRILEARAEFFPVWNAIPPSEGDSAPALPSPVIGRASVDFNGNPNLAPCIDIPSCEALASPGAKNVSIADNDDRMVWAGGDILGGNTGVPSTQLKDSNKEGNDTSIPGVQPDNPDDFFSWIFTPESRRDPADPNILVDPITKGEFREGATVVSGGNLPNTNLNPVVWHDGDLTINGGTLGSPDRPVTLVVDGDVNMTGNVIVWGVVYMTGTDFAAGTSKIFGTLVGENDITIRGNHSVFFNVAFSEPGEPVDSGEVAATLESLEIYYSSDSWRELPAMDP